MAYAPLVSHTALDSTSSRVACPLTLLTMKKGLPSSIFLASYPALIGNSLHLIVDEQLRRTPCPTHRMHECGQFAAEGALVISDDFPRLVVRVVVAIVDPISSSAQVDEQPVPACTIKTCEQVFVSVIFTIAITGYSLWQHFHCFHDWYKLPGCLYCSFSFIAGWHKTARQAGQLCLSAF